MVQQGLLGCFAVEAPVDLGAGSPDRRPFGTVEHSKLNTRRIRQTAHQPIQRVDFSDEVPFPQSTDGGVTGHLPEGVDSMGDEEGAGARACSSGSGFRAGVSSTHDDDVPYHGSVSDSAVEKDGGSSVSGA